MSSHKVVITGMGVVSPLGCDLDVFWKKLCEGESGIRAISLFDASAMDARIAGEVTGFDVDKFVSKKEQRRMDPFCYFALAAAKMAVDDSGLNFDAEDLNRCGTIVGSGIGGLQTLEAQHKILLERGPSRCSPFMIPQMIINMASGLVAIAHHLKGPNFSVVTACASSTHCIGEAMRILQRGEADVIIAGGAEATVSPLGIAGFCAMHALSTRNDAPTKACRPFDANRDGFIMGEGAGIVVLETLEHASKRNARIYAEVAGYGATCDANHITAPVEGGEGAARAMTLAIRDGGMTPDDIDYVNAHGTSTKLNDMTETAAIKGALGNDRAHKIMVGSSKSMTGHMLGAAGAIEAIVCALTMKHGIVTPTINYETPDPLCDLDYIPNTARTTKVRACLNNSLGFGGHNATLLLKTV